MRCASLRIVPTLPNFSHSRSDPVTFTRPADAWRVLSNLLEFQLMSFGGSKGSSKSSTNQQASSTSTETPNNLPYVQQGWDLASKLFGNTNDNGATFNNGRDLAATGANAATGAITGGLNTAGQLANGGTGNAANKYLTPFADGSMNGSNPYFQNTIDLLTQSLRPQVDGNFAASGRYGSGANAHAFADALTKAASGMAYQNYNDSTNRSLQAGQALSANNANSTGQQISALDVLRGLSGQATQPGTSEASLGLTPANTYAGLLQAFGPGGGSQTSNGTSSGTVKGSSSSMGFSFDLSKLFPIPTR